MALDFAVRFYSIRRRRHRGDHEYRLCYIHGAVGIIVALAEQL